ncbi:MAG: ATP-binding cassette domain-containing protein [Bacteroidia bacterium]
MEITLVQLSKRFNFTWLFRDLNHTFSPGSRTVILGSNGSGKSRLLLIMAGYAPVSEGSICWKVHTDIIAADKLYQYISLATPYLELIEEFTLREHIEFHFTLKPVCQNLTVEELLQLSGLADKSEMRLSYFSSGMKQRVRLLLAILSDTPLVLLDEPASNLDEKAIGWYNDLIDQFGTRRTIVVCSNSVAAEYAFCTEQIDLSKR